jgi:hypothetical protein
MNQVKEITPPTLISSGFQLLIEFNAWCRMLGGWISEESPLVLALALFAMW